MSESESTPNENEVSATIDGIDYPYPTLAQAGQAFTVSVSKLADYRNNLPTFTKAGFVLSGYGLSMIPGGVGASYEGSATPQTEQEAVDCCREAWSEVAGFGASEEMDAAEVSKIDWSKFNWQKALAGITSLIALIKNFIPAA